MAEQQQRLDELSRRAEGSGADEAKAEGREGKGKDGKKVRFLVDADKEKGWKYTADPENRYGAERRRGRGYAGDVYSP